jgi:hypothetical protein
MSREFDSLQKTSELPSWLTSEEQLAEYWLLEIGGTHGNESDHIDYIRSRLGKGAFPHGVLPVIANRAAADVGERYIDDEQLMAWYPGRFSWQAGPNERLTNEEQTAAGITWLIGRLAMKHLAIDRHQSNNQSARFAAFGPRTTPAALAAAHLMRHTNMLCVPWSKFDQMAPRSLCIEEPVPEEPAAKHDYFQRADEQIRQIASLGEAGLAALYHDEQLWKDKNYYGSLTEIALVDPRTQAPLTSVLNVLKELEDIGSDAAFGDELDLTQRVREGLGLDPHEQYFINCVGYQNVSPQLSLPAKVLSAAGLSEDRERRLYWGTLMTRGATPKIIAGSDFMRGQ